MLEMKWIANRGNVDVGQIHPKMNLEGQGVGGVRGTRFEVLSVPGMTPA